MSSVTTDEKSYLTGNPLSEYHPMNSEPFFIGTERISAEPPLITVREATSLPPLLSKETEYVGIYGVT